MGQVTTSGGAKVDTNYNGKEKFATYNGKSSNAMSADELRTAIAATSGMDGEGAEANDIFARALKSKETEELGMESQRVAMEQIGYARDYADKAAAQAGNIDPYVSRIDAYRKGLDSEYSMLRQRAGAIDPYIRDFNNWAGSLWDMGTGLAGQGRGLLDMDGSNDPNSLMGRYEAWVRQMDPDRYVAVAAEDVQKSFDNVLRQQVRDMGRAGYDASSTRTAEFRQRFNQGLAAALAGAKFRARQQGLSDMGGALDKALAQAESAIGQGVSVQTAGANMRSAAAQLENVKTGVLKDAADVRKTQAAMAQTMANLQSQKAQIYNNAATAMLGGAQAAIGSAQVDLGYYRADLDYQAAMSAGRQKSDNSALWGAGANAAATIAAAAILA